jgi:hypothetical protein
MRIEKYICCRRSGDRKSIYCVSTSGDDGGKWRVENRKLDAILRDSCEMAKKGGGYWVTSV